MTKKQIRLEKSLMTKNSGGVAKMDDLLDSVKRTEQEEEVTRMNFEARRSHYPNRLIP